MKICKLPTSCFFVLLNFFFCLYCNAVDLYDLTIDKVELKINNAVVTVVKKENKILKVEVLSNDRSFSIPEIEIGSFLLPDLSSIHISTTISSKFNSLAEIGENEYFIIRVDFGDRQEYQPEHKIGSRIYAVKNTVYFIFGNNGYICYNKRVIDIKSNKSSLYTKFLGKREYFHDYQDILDQDGSTFGPHSITVKN